MPASGAGLLGLPGLLDPAGHLVGHQGSLRQRQHVPFPRGGDHLGVREGVEELKHLVSGNLGVGGAVHMSVGTSSDGAMRVSSLKTLASVVALKARGGVLRTS